ncbi:MAG: 4Fe-4S cluster-binding domain-containing protein [Clostridia bacterium]|nr:4Fe-4S cluster-binding domain-containing protein [Clostridia bacterium]
MTKGRIHSFQSLGTVDGPGVRFVVFMQGCALRCGCCHNPDTWELSGGNEFSPEEVLDKILRYRGYFGDRGGLTISGGEPLLQTEFVCRLFSLARQNGINTCLDTRARPLPTGSERFLTFATEFCWTSNTPPTKTTAGLLAVRSLLQPTP